MKHPEILDFFPPDTGLETIMKVWKDNPELYKFIQALDAYIDHLEENYVKSESMKMLNDLIKNGLPQDIQNSIHRIETAHGDILVRKLDFLASNEIELAHNGKIITNEEALDAIGDQLSEEDKSILRQQSERLRSNDFRLLFLEDAPEEVNRFELPNLCHLCNENQVIHGLWFCQECGRKQAKKPDQ